MTEDTKAILAALDVAIRVLDRECVDGKCKLHLDEHNAKDTLRALRSRIEKERPFLEAAMAMVELTLPGAGYWNALVKTKRQLERQARERLETAYRALTEKPPEEGA